MNGKLKAWRFQMDDIGYGDTPEEAWESLLHELTEAPHHEREPEQDVEVVDE